MWQRSASFVIKYRLILLISLFAATALMGFFASKVKLSYDFAKVQDYKAGVVSKNSAGVAYLMKKNKVTVFNGFGTIAGKGKVEVAYEDGKKETRHFIQISKVKW